MSNSEFDHGKHGDDAELARIQGTISATGDADDPLPVDLIFDALSNERRQRALIHLQRVERTTLGDLAEHVAAWENNTTIGSVARETRSRVYTGLYHSHVPRLADMGIVEYDRETDMVSLTSKADAIVPYLDAVDERIN